MLWSKKKTSKEEFKQMLFEFNNILAMLDKESRNYYFKSNNIEQFDFKEFLEFLRNFLGNEAYREITSDSKSIPDLLRYLLVIRLCPRNEYLT